MVTSDNILLKKRRFAVVDFLCFPGLDRIIFLRMFNGYDDLIICIGHKRTRKIKTLIYSKIQLKPTMQIKILRNRLAIIIFITLLSGCGTESDKQIIFNAEKSLNQAEQLFNTASIKPDLSDLETWREVKDAYLSTITYCWTHLDSLTEDSLQDDRKGLESVAFMATARLASIYYADSKFDSSVIILNQLLSLTHLSGRPLLSTQSNLARAYHAAGDWNSGIDVYKSIISTFYPPIDEDKNIITEVLNLPLELLKINISLQNVPNTFEATESTRDYYQRIIAEWPNTDLEKAARRMLAELLSDFSQWDMAIETLRAIKDSTGQTAIPESIRIADFLSEGKQNHSEAISVYQGLLDRTADLALKANIQIKIAITHYRNSAYSDCLETLKYVKNNFNTQYMSSALPQKYVALSYEKQNKWDRAEDEYKWLITNFPNTEMAFDAYLTIADHYENSKNNQMAKLWYDKADEFYSKMQAENQGSSIEASAISYRAEVARRLENWENAAERLEELFNRFPNMEIGVKALRNAINIYRNRLNNSAKADSLQSLFGFGT